MQTPADTVSAEETQASATHGLTSDFPDLRAVPLEAVRCSGPEHDRRLRRIAPRGERRLLVAASFNSAI